MLFSFERITVLSRNIDLVTMEKWSHLVPSRTQKLSTCSASIAIVNQARRQVNSKISKDIFFIYKGNINDVYIYGIDVFSFIVESSTTLDIGVLLFW